MEQFDQIYALLEQSFPKGELRTYEGQKALLNRKEYGLRLLDKEGTLQALIGFWKFDDFCFIEHFCVNPNLRGGGIGGSMLEKFLRDINKPVILEVERPLEELAKRRVCFYQRHGFSLNAFGYRQPKLQPDGTQVELQLMSWPEALQEGQAESIRQVLFKKVYQTE